MIIWPAAGFAVAVLIRLGLYYAIGVFAGALAAGLLANTLILVSITDAIGDTFSLLLTVYLLRFLPFSNHFYRLNDYLSFVFASGIAVAVSVVFVALLYHYAGFADMDDFYGLVMNWWMSDVLGMVILTPLLLLYSRGSLLTVITQQFFEVVLLLVFTTFIALMVLLGWDFGIELAIKSSYLLTIPLLWSILRFGQVMTALVAFEYTVVGVCGLLLNQGFFVDANSQANMILFWTYFMVMGLISLTISYIVNERNMLYQAINQSQAGSYIFNGRNLQFEFINNATLNALGVPFREALKLGPVDLKPLYDQQQFKTMLSPLLNKQRTALRFETVIKSGKDNDFYPAEVHIQNIDHMNRDCYFASVIDISERLAKEQQLRLGNQVCELTPQAIMITNKDNVIIRVNKAFCDITGYQADEVLGCAPDILNADGYNKLYYQAFWQRLHDEKIWKGEVYSGRKNGETYLQSLTIKLLHDEQGEIENYIAMFTDITKEREQSLYFKQLAEFDHLTGLPNRTLLQQRFQSALSSAKRHQRQLAVIYIDLNDFKPINDAYGHTIGDKVLREIAVRMKVCVRDGDTVSRIGGDEFSILLHEVDHATVCDAMIDRLKEAIAKPVIIEDVIVQMTASMGIANYPEQGDSLEALLNFADLAMYNDKEKMKQI